MDASMITLTMPDGGPVDLDEGEILSVGTFMDSTELQLPELNQRVSETADAIVARLRTTLTLVPLTAPNGAPVWINAAAILRIGRDVELVSKDGACIYFREGLRRVQEEPKSIVSHLEGELSFIQLTQPDNNPVWINVAAITRMRRAAADDHPNIRTVLETGRVYQGVREDIATIQQFRRILDANRERLQGGVAQPGAQSAEGPSIVSQPKHVVAQPGAQSVDSPSTSAQPPHVVILVHGIRDFALWEDAIGKVLKGQQFIAQSTNYGRYDLFRFLLPVSYFRNKAIESIWNQIRDVRKQYPHPDTTFSFIAHSFGTYIVAQILRREFDFAAYRVIFCGSVVKYNFPFEQYSNRFVTPILNEVGARDVWPAIAESVTWGYGSAGTYSFHRPRVIDRWHSGAGHGYFLNAEFCRQYWIPFLKDGTIVETETKHEAPAFWLQTLYVFRLKYLLAALVAILVALVYR